MIKMKAVLLCLLLGLASSTAGAADTAAPDKTQVDPVQLQQYVLAAMVYWSAPDKHPLDGTPEQELVRYRQIATDIVEAVLEPSEIAVWSNDKDMHRAAILLTVLAFFESGFRPFVDSGLCNDRVWQQKHKTRNGGDCDGGHAWTMWQIHANSGTWHVSLKGNGVEFVDPADPGALSGAQLVKNRVMAARVALHMARSSLRSRGHNLKFYTGERGVKTPKADARLDVARRYWIAHPYRQVDAESSPAPVAAE